MDESGTSSTGVTATGGEQPVVLVVDDDEDLADTYALWLTENYETRTAYSGAEAIEQLTDDVDVVLLDRRMPSTPGDEVLAAIRERGLNCQVSMLTAVEPDSDIVDLPFDEYLVKPVTKAEVVDAVDELILRRSLGEDAQDYLALEATEETLAEREDEKFEDEAVVEALHEEVQTAAQSEAVQRQVAELDRLKEINGLIRSVDEALVEARSRGGIEDAVCRRLVDDGPYAFAWIGDHVGAFDQLTPRASSAGAVGDDAIDLTGETVAAAIDADEVVAVDPGEVSAVGRVFDRAGLDEGYAALVVPLTYRDTVYGVLVVATGGERTVSDRELAVLGELGDTIANAINAAESRQLAMADRVVEVELQVADDADVMVSMARSLSATVSLEGFVPASEGSLACYLAVEAADSDAVYDFLAAADAVATHRAINDRDGTSLVEVNVEGDSVLLTLLEAGANPMSMYVADGDAHVTAEVAPDADLRTVLEAVQSGFPDTEMVAKRESNRSVQSTERFRQRLADELTDRQQSVLEATFSAGYFEWPRESTAEEIAEALDLAPPTLHEHLREAQRKLIATYLDDGED